MDRLRGKGPLSAGKMNLVALLHAISGAGALITSVYTETTFLAPVKLIQPLGLAIFAGGLILFAMVVATLKRAFLGDVEPVTDRLITTGPYRFVRHPLYLGMFVTTIGLAIAFRSLWGLLITLAVFVPAGLWRAKLEEEALGRRFGEEWEAYARRTGFMFPVLY
jgi:protein-S-isoprenylcysteine O-methyltransferase Ste14